MSSGGRSKDVVPGAALRGRDVCILTYHYGNGLAKFPKTFGFREKTLERKGGTNLNTLGRKGAECC